MDYKEKILKAIKKNHEDGLTQPEIQRDFNIGRYEVEVILNELQIEQRVRVVKFSRFKVYKENK